ncbi:TPA: hypothetical protein P0E30_003732 [Vibrio harveyi]|nr:hypothetical protein [Vibrio harveyi]
MKNLKLASIIGLLVLTGCTASGSYDFCTFGNVDTEIRSYADKHDYYKVLVIGDHDFSTAACNRFKSKGVECKEYDEVFNPLKTYTHEQASKILVAERFDSVLALEARDSDSSQSYAGSISNFSATQSGNSINGYGSTIPLTMTNGFSKAKVIAYDVKTDEKIYMADTNTSGSGTACVNNYIFLRSMAETVVDDIMSK